MTSRIATREEVASLLGAGLANGRDVIEAEGRYEVTFMLNLDTGEIDGGTLEDTHEGRFAHFVLMEFLGAISGIADLEWQDFPDPETVG